jgi:hypothetical protein
MLFSVRHSYSGWAHMRLLFGIIMHQNSSEFVFQDSYFLITFVATKKWAAESEPTWLLVQLMLSSWPK